VLPVIGCSASWDSRCAVVSFVLLMESSIGEMSNLLSFVGVEVMAVDKK